MIKRKVPVNSVDSTPTRAQRVLRFIGAFCICPEGPGVGKPIVLDQFQIDFIVDVYDNPAVTHTAILSIARKNGKTALIACLMLVHLVGPEALRNSQIVSGALSRDQASAVFNYATKIVNLSPKLATIVRSLPSKKEMFGLPMNTAYKALSADGKTQQGLSPVLAILDETGQISGPQSAFVDAVTTAQGAYTSPLLIYISTQAALDTDLFSILIDDALTPASGVRDPQIVCHLYAAEKGCAINDRAQWLAANPALGTFRSVEDLEKQAKKAEAQPSFENTFRNLNLNQRVVTTSPMIAKATWDLNAGTPKPLDSTMKIYGGLDLSTRFDLTAFVLIGEELDGTTHVHPYFFTPEGTLLERSKKDRAPYDVWVKQGYLIATKGSCVDYEVVAQKIGELVVGLPVVAICFDRYRIDFFNKECARLDPPLELPMQELAQGPITMGPCIDELEAALLDGKLRHGNHPVMNMCAVQARVHSDPKGNRILYKTKATGRMDGIQALAVAYGAKLHHTPAPEPEEDAPAIIDL